MPSKNMYRLYYMRVNSKTSRNIVWNRLNVPKTVEFTNKKEMLSFIAETRRTYHVVWELLYWEKYTFEQRVEL